MRREPRFLRRRGRRGQSMVEFALIVPVLMFTIIGIFEFGLLAFGIGSARFAVSEGARVVAQVGRGVNTPVTANVAGGVLSGWPRPGGVVSDCDADCEALVAMHGTTLADPTFAQVDEVDIWQLHQDPSTGVYSGGTTATANASQPAWTTSPQNPQFPSTGPINRYRWNGSKFSLGSSETAYPTSGGTVACPPTTGRNDCSGSSDFLAVTVQYHYTYKSGLFQRLGNPYLYTTYYVRIEPQRY